MGMRLHYSEVSRPTRSGAFAGAYPFLLSAVVSVVVIFAGLPALGGTGVSGRVRNVLFFLADDMQAEAIAAQGHPVVKTPTLDRLVQEGFVFRRCYIMGSTMPAVCIPSRAMLWSGRTLWRVPADLKNVVTLPQLLRQHNYETFITGKWHNGRPSLARSFSAGQAIFFGGMSDHNRVPIFDFDPTGKYPEAAQRKGDRFSSALFADAAADFIKSYRGEKPFFVLVSFTAPHDPRTPPPEFAKMYDPQAIPLPPNFLPEHPFDNGELKVRDELLAPFPRTAEVIRQHLADYYGMISHLDAQVGRVLAALMDSPHMAQTLVIFTADNGLAIGRHGLLGKQNLYEHSIRVPLILWGPGISPGQSDELVYLHDLFPTICEALGLPVPEAVEGQSLWPIVDGRVARGREFLIFGYRDQQRAIRMGKWKLIRYRVGGQEIVQLFDVESDPWEIVNLANSPAYVGMKQKLVRLLDEECRRLGDPTAE
ncbi:MAG: sulfatase-like hydrolase/transferase [Thermoguttaceae bacterium]|nr:sulfatase-like hydrolase/transferase [Thermoguttaceae bacterium]MDW8078702.1 sulfatase-like hydrolase/transferase [Thermoguttaceae bacterium]